MKLCHVSCHPQHSHFKVTTTTPVMELTIFPSPEIIDNYSTCYWTSIRQLFPGKAQINNLFWLENPIMSRTFQDFSLINVYRTWVFKGFCARNSKDLTLGSTMLIAPLTSKTFMGTSRAFATTIYSQLVHLTSKVDSVVDSTSVHTRNYPSFHVL